MGTGSTLVIVALINGASHVRKAGRSENILEGIKVIIGGEWRSVGVWAQVPAANPTPPFPQPSIFQVDGSFRNAICTDTRYNLQERDIRGRSHRRVLPPTIRWAAFPHD